VSQHLAKLRLARTVATRHDGARVFSRLVDEHARFQAEHSVDASPRHHRLSHGADAGPGDGDSRGVRETVGPNRE